MTTPPRPRRPRAGRTGPLASPETMTKFVENRFALAGLVLVAVAALYGAAAFSRPSQPAAPQSGGRAPVGSALVVCPDPRGGGDLATRVGTLAWPGSRRSGRADMRQTQSGPGGPVVAQATTPGVVGYQDTKGVRDSLDVRATGSMATGLEVEQTSGVGSGTGRGLAGMRCSEPGSDMWFIGPGPGDADSLDLYLTNVDDQAAAVDLEALSDSGPLDTIDGRGTPVDPHTTKVIHIGRQPEGLGKVVAAAQIVALHVRANAGRVAAAVRVRAGDGKGFDWVPATTTPAGQLIVPGVPSGGGGRQLLIAVPGRADATVRVQVMTADGAFAPQGQETQVAPAQTVTAIPLERALSGKAAGVRLTSNQPILAAFVARAGVRGGGQDIALGAAIPAIEESGVAADNRGRSGADSRMLLTAPDKPATVRVTLVTPQGAAAGAQEVKVPAGRTAEVRLQPPAGAEDGYGVVVTPQTGTVYAARVLTTAEGSTVLPLLSARTWVAVPPVGDSMTALVP